MAGICGRRLRLSRFNPRVPGREAPLGVVQGTAQFHHQIADVLLPQADPVCDEATALHTAVDMRDLSPVDGAVPGRVVSWSA